jgi:3-isopropylmalate/(R)-2-methylmalate dehydratase small subunit
MQPFTRLDGVAVALPIANVDTDQLLPARFLKVPRSQGYARLLMHDLRFDENGNERAAFPLNAPKAQGAKILIARKNFGGGSSREGAVYALVDFGIRCVIAPSFGDIFSGNAVNNGLLTALVSEQEAEALMAAVDQTRRATVNLEDCSIVAGNLGVTFSIDPVRRTKLLNGWDDIDMTRSYAAEIGAFVARDSAARPWALPNRRGAGAAS